MAMVVLLAGTHRVRWGVRPERVCVCVNVSESVELPVWFESCSSCVCSDTLPLPPHPQPPRSPGPAGQPGDAAGSGRRPRGDGRLVGHHPAAPVAVHGAPAQRAAPRVAAPPTASNIWGLDAQSPSSWMETTPSDPRAGWGHPLGHGPPGPVNP